MTPQQFSLTTCLLYSAAASAVNHAKQMTAPKHSSRLQILVRWFRDSPQSVLALPNDFFPQLSSNLGNGTKRGLTWHESKQTHKSATGKRQCHHSPQCTANSETKNGCFEAPNFHLCKKARPPSCEEDILQFAKHVTNSVILVLPCLFQLNLQKLHCGKGYI